MTAFFKSRAVRRFLLLLFVGGTALFSVVVFVVKKTMEQDLALLESRLGIVRSAVLYYDYETGGPGDGYHSYVIVRLDEASVKGMEEALKRYPVCPDAFLERDFEQVGSYFCEDVRRFFEKKGIKAVFRETDRPGIIRGYNDRSLIYIVPDVSMRYAYIDLDVR